MVSKNQIRLRPVGAVEFRQVVHGLFTKTTGTLVPVGRLNNPLFSLNRPAGTDAAVAFLTGRE